MATRPVAGACGGKSHGCGQVVVAGGVDIQEALEAPIVDPRDLSRRLIDALFPDRNWLTRTRQWWDRLRGGPSPMDGAVEQLVARVRLETRLIVSEHLMSITLPPAP